MSRLESKSLPVPEMDRWSRSLRTDSTDNLSWNLILAADAATEGAMRLSPRLKEEEHLSLFKKGLTGQSSCLGSWV